MRKLLVTDLDGTLWDGTIGDVGRAKIKPNAPYQRLLLKLQRRGVLLAVCSKNDMDTALAGLDHPDSMMERDDFVAFVANWDDKVTNLQRIAEQLNIGLDAMVFVDDSPFERGLVAEVLPMVKVVNPIEEDISDSFSDAVVTTEDSHRTGYYSADRKRILLKDSFATVESYVASLEQRLTWDSFTEDGLPRIAQLVNRTNQFNLTTRRRTTAELKAFIGSPFALQFWLADKFGPSGMIGVIIATNDSFYSSALYIDTWLMSCRVIGRGVEKMMFDVFCQQAEGRTLVGEYRPTSRNGLVKYHYSKLGFNTIGEGWYDFDVRADNGNHSADVGRSGYGVDTEDEGGRSPDVGQP